MVFEAAECGDDRARAVILRAADYLGIGLAILANLVDPEAVVVGGGLGARGGWYLQAAVATMRDHALRANGALTPVVQAQLGEAAGLFGAAELARDNAAGT
jgi:glucokinase